MKHCDPCGMPAALEAAGDQGSYSLIKHAIIETRECVRDPLITEQMRVAHEAQGTLEVFNAAARCVNCIHGMRLLVNGNETWQVGGAEAAQ